MSSSLLSNKEAAILIVGTTIAKYPNDLIVANKHPNTKVLPVLLVHQ